MEFLRFVILSENDQQGVAGSEQTILLNPKHIVSIKPIKLVSSDQRVLEAFWIRLTNGKKYRATQIPPIIYQTFLKSPIEPKHYANFDNEDSFIH